MADFLFTGPNGEKFKVSGPDQAGAIEAFKQSQQGRPAPQPPTQERLNATANADKIAEAQIVRSGSGGLAGGIVAKGAQGLPFVGEWVDEGLDIINPGAGGRMNQITDSMDTLNPKTALAAEIVGGVAGSIPLAIGAVGTAGKAATTAGKALMGASMGATAGAVDGALQGSGAASAGERVSGGIQGAGIGAGLGGVFGGLAPIVGSGARAVAQRVKRLDVGTIADRFGISKRAARVVKGALANDDLDAARAAISRAGDDAMLADAGPATRQLLDAAQQSGGEALSKTRGRIDARAGQQGAQFKKVIDSVLGKPAGARTATREIATRTAPARKAAYDRAFSTPIDYSQAGRKVEAVLERIPPKTLNAAVQEVNEAMIAEGAKNMQILADIADDGSVVFREMPNVQQLNQIKIELGNIAQGETDNITGKVTARGVRASKLAEQLRDAVAEAVPSYKQALKLGGDKIAEENSLNMGRKLLSKSTTFEDVITQMRGASKEAKESMRQGLRQNLDSIMENAKTTLAEIEAGNFDFETGQNAAKESLDALRALTTPANFKKAKAALGADAKQLFFELERTSDAMALRASLARNSATAIRQSIQGQVKDEATPGLVRRTLGKGGNPLDAAREVTESIAGIDPRSMNDRQRAMFAEIADALTGIRGKEAQEALRAVKGAMRGQPIKDAQADLIGRLVAGSGAAVGYQSASQPLN